MVQLPVLNFAILCASGKSNDTSFPCYECCHCADSHRQKAMEAGCSCFRLKFRGLKAVHSLVVSPTRSIKATEGVSLLQASGN